MMLVKFMIYNHFEDFGYKKEMSVPHAFFWPHDSRVEPIRPGC